MLSIAGALAVVLSQQPVVAQAVARLFGTTSTGLPIALKADNSGNLKVSIQGGTVATPLLAPDGSKALPSHSFSSEPSSGWYRAGAGDVRLSVLNTDRFVAGPSTTTVNAPDGGAYFIESNGSIQFNSATLNLASSGSTRISFPTPAADGNLKYTNNAGTRSIITDISGTPTCSTNCGTSPSVSGNNSLGTVTMGSTGVPASGWVLTFTNTWASAPQCTVTSALTSMVAGKAAIAVQTSTTTMTVTTNGTAPSNSDKYFYSCGLGG